MENVQSTLCYTNGCYLLKCVWKYCTGLEYLYNYLLITLIRFNLYNITAMADHDLVFWRCRNKEPHSSGFLCRVVLSGTKRRNVRRTWVTPCYDQTQNILLENIENHRQLQGTREEKLLKAENWKCTFATYLVKKSGENIGSWWRPPIPGIPEGCSNITIWQGSLILLHEFLLTLTGWLRLTSARISNYYKTATKEQNAVFQDCSASTYNEELTKKVMPAGRHDQ